MTMSTTRVQGGPYRRLSLLVLGVALVSQCAWIAWRIATVGFAVNDLWRPLTFTTAFVLVAVTRGGVSYINALGRVTIACAFLLALWSRFQNFPGFVRYTESVLSFMPLATIPLLAVAATVCEVSLCLAMLVGFKTRWASAGAAILLSMFATSMVISGLSQFEWAVYVLAAGAFVLATVNATFLSVDSLLFRKEATPGWIS
jgi:putative oxidoreductase